ncbi:SGNH/GDSL hydrolase family protein [Novosphingobium sp. RD2P27]|uniref:SGNH/GDSL hydrolase family protein n=1 Tax=Novosphingobium kalidii TaxID=3230299 RepID=A0ABV2CZX2_9SPHN
MLAVMIPAASPREIANQRLLDRLRRTAKAADISNPRIAGTVSTPPIVVDHGATFPALTSSTLYPCNGVSQGVWHVVGGRYASGGRISAGVQDGVPNQLNSYARWEVMADSRYFTARLGPTSVPYRFIVDGRYVSLSGTVLETTTGNTDQYLTLDFGSRAVRRIVVEAMRTGRLAGGAVEDGAALWPVDASDVPHTVFLGDSYVFGSGPDLTADGVAVQMADRMGLALQASGSGGTGWNQSASHVYRFDQRIDNGDLGLAYHSPEVIFLHASVNDAYAGQDNAIVKTNALAGLRSARAQFPGVPIIVFGCIAAPNRSESFIAAAEASVAQAVAAFADPLCRFVPINGDPQGRWISGSGSELRFSTTLSDATSATLATPWPAGTSASTYTIIFSDGSTRLASFTQNGTKVTWSGPVTAGAMAMVRQTEGNARFTIHPDWIHPSSYGAAYIGERYARSALAVLEDMLG